MVTMMEAHMCKRCGYYYLHYGNVVVMPVRGMCVDTAATP